MFNDQHFHLVHFCRKTTIEDNFYSFIEKRKKAESGRIAEKSPNSGIFPQKAEEVATPNIFMAWKKYDCNLLIRFMKMSDMKMNHI